MARNTVRKPDKDLRDVEQLPGDPAAGYSPRPDLPGADIWFGTKHHIMGRLDIREAHILIDALKEAVAQHAIVQIEADRKQGVPNG